MGEDTKSECIGFYEQEAVLYDARRFSCRCRRLYDLVFRRSVSDVLGEAVKVLDAGTGTGRFALVLGSKGKSVVSLDASLAMLRIARDKAATQKLDHSIAFVQGDLEQLPFVDGIFDGLTCIHVLVHFREVGKAVEEFSRVLKPGGRAVVEIANPYSARIANVLWKLRSKRSSFSYPDYYHTLKTFRKTFEENGFKLAALQRIRKIPRILVHPFLCWLRLPIPQGIFLRFEKLPFGLVSISVWEKVKH